MKPKNLVAIEDKSDDNKKHLKYKEVFNEISREKMDKINKISKEIDFNILTYYLNGPNLALINFIGFRGPLNIYEEIKNGSASIKKNRKSCQII